MDVEPAATEPRTPAADSRTPAAEPRTPDADSRVPHAESRTPVADDVAEMNGIDTQASEAAEEDDGSDGDEGSHPEDATEVPVLSATALLSYCADDALSVDLPVGQLGPICRTMAVDLDARPGRWFRCGVYGDARCAIAAYLQASGASPSARVTFGRVQGWGSAGQTRNHVDCDDWRPLMKGWIAQLSESALHRLQQVVLHVGNSGFDNRGADIPGEDAEQRTPTGVGRPGSSCWTTWIDPTRRSGGTTSRRCRSGRASTSCCTRGCMCRTHLLQAASRLSAGGRTPIKKGGQRRKRGDRASANLVAPV